MAVVRLDAVRRLERMRRRRAIRAAAVALVNVHGAGWAGRLAGASARDLRFTDRQRTRWGEIETEIARINGFGWWWPDEAADAPCSWVGNSDDPGAATGAG